MGHSNTTPDENNTNSDNVNNSLVLSFMTKGWCPKMIIKPHYILQVHLLQMLS